MERDMFSPKCWECLNDEQYEIISNWYSQIKKEQREKEVNNSNSLMYAFYIFAIWLGAKPAYLEMKSTSIVGVFFWLNFIWYLALFVGFYIFGFCGLLLIGDNTFEKLYLPGGKIKRVCVCICTCLIFAAIRIVLFEKTNI